MYAADTMCVVQYILPKKRYIFEKAYACIQYNKEETYFLIEPKFSRSWRRMGRCTAA